MPPVNDNVVDATLISPVLNGGASTLTGQTTVAATVESGEPAAMGQLNAPSVWYRVELPEHLVGNIIVTTTISNADYKYLAQVFRIPAVDDPPANPTDVSNGSFRGSIGLGTTGNDSEIDTEAGTGVIYYVYVANWDADADVGNFDISVDVVSGPPGNDARLTADDSGNVGFMRWWDSYIYADFDDPSQGLENGPVAFFNTNRCRPGTTIAATAEGGDPAILGFAATRNVWFAFEPSYDGTYRFTVEPRGATPVLDPLIAIYTWTTGALGAALAADDDSGPGLYPTVDLAMTAFQKVAICVDARDAGDFTVFAQRLPVGSPPANDDFANAEAITGGVSFSGDTTDATGECGETPSAGFWGGPYNSVWYTYTPAADGMAAVELTTGPTGGDGNDLLVDIFKGSTLDTLENITDADNFQTNFYNETIFVPFIADAGVPIYIRVIGFENQEAAFTGELVVQSTTPPDNDDIGDAETIPPGGGGGGGGAEHTIPGSTDGSTIEANEPHPIIGGQAPATSGSVWYEYTAPAPGFVTAYADSAEVAAHWPSVHLWAGDAKPNLTIVRPRRLSNSTGTSNGPYGYSQSHFEVREGEHYFIQVYRATHQLWGDFDLHFVEHMETIDWEYTADGFDTTIGSPDFSPTDPDADMEVEGAEEYGTFDAGAAPPKWNREFTVNMEIKCLGGGVLVRHGGEESPFTDPTKKNRRLGLFRIRDVDDVARFWLYLYPGSEGRNHLSFGSDDLHRVNISIGDSHKDDLGWVKIEMKFIADNAQIATHTGTVTWRLLIVHIDNKPYEVDLSFVSKRPRYFDFGFWRYTTQTVATENNVESPENWIMAYRRMAVTNIVPREPYDFEAVDTVGDPDDLKIQQFDFFATGQSWHRLLHEFTLGSTEGSFTNNSASASDALDLAYLPLEEAPWDPTMFAIHSLDPVNTMSVAKPFTMGYDGQWGSRRWHGFWFYAEQFPQAGADPDDFMGIAGYTISGAGAGGLAGLKLAQSGQLNIIPYIEPDFCLAFLAEEEGPYFITCRTDAEVMWDVKVRVFINGVDFGEYTNARDWNWLLAFPGTPQERSVYGEQFQTSAHWTLREVKFGAPAVSGSFWHDHELWFTGFVMGRGNLYEGETFASTLEAGIDAEAGHGIPSVPAESIYLRGVRNGVGGGMEENAWRAYGWDVEDGPETFSQAWPPPGPFSPPTTENTTRSFTTPTSDGVLGDSVLAVVMASGAGNLVGAVQEWDPGGGGGSIEPTNTHLTEALSGTPKQYWSTALPFWVSTLGTGVIPRISWGGGSGTLQMDDFRLLQNPLIYPRFTYTDDDGATYTWIEPGDTDSADFIGSDVTVDNSTEAVYTDTSGALTRQQVNDGNIVGHGATAHHANNMPYHYIEYSTPGSDEYIIHAVHLWARWKGHWGPPRADTAVYDGQFRADFALDDGVRSLGLFENTRVGSATPMGTSAADHAVIDRHSAMRAPDGTKWSGSNIPEVMLRLGFHNVILTDNHDYELNTDAQAFQSDQRSGAKIYQLATEFLIDGPTYDPPAGCFTIIAMNWRSSDRPGSTTRRVLRGD